MAAWGPARRFTLLPRQRWPLRLWKAASLIRSNIYDAYPGVLMKVTGGVWKFPQDDINTDQIRRKIYAHLPAREQAKYCFADLDSQFAAKVTPGDILVVGRNFGCGSST